MALCSLLGFASLEITHLILYETCNVPSDPATLMWITVKKKKKILRKQVLTLKNVAQWSVLYRRRDKKIFLILLKYANNFNNVFLTNKLLKIAYKKSHLKLFRSYWIHWVLKLAKVKAMKLENSNYNIVAYLWAYLSKTIEKRGKFKITFHKLENRVKKFSYSWKFIFNEGN